MLLSFMTCRCGKSSFLTGTDLIFFLSSTWHDSNTLDLHIDASGALGYGGIYGNKDKWFQGKWKSHQLLDQPEVSIAWQQLYAIVVAYEIWDNLLHDQRIRFTTIMSL